MRTKLLDSQKITIIEDGGLITRRNVLIGSGLCAVLVVSSPFFGKNEAYAQSTAGLIYVVAPNGDLQWFRHEGRNDGSFRWTDNNPRKVGQGWGDAKHVFSGGDGVIYVVAPNGDLQWFRHEGRNDGSFRWTDNNPRKVGQGWGDAKHVFSG